MLLILSCMCYHVSMLSCICYQCINVIMHVLSMYRRHQCCQCICYRYYHEDVIMLSIVSASAFLFSNCINKIASGCFCICCIYNDLRGTVLLYIICVVLCYYISLFAWYCFIIYDLRGTVLLYMICVVLCYYISLFAWYCVIIYDLRGTVLLYIIICVVLCYYI